MESMELLKMIDEIRKRLKVTHQEAKAALERNEYNVLEAILDLEGASHRQSAELSRKTREFVREPSVTLRRKGKDLFKLPAFAAGGALLLGLVRPRFLAASFAAVLLSGTDIAVSSGSGREYSLRETFRNRSGKAAANVADMRDKLDDRFHDMKDLRFPKETRDQGLDYFTVKL